MRHTKPKTKVWRVRYNLPRYLVQTFGDSGMVEYHKHEMSDIEKDDLRVHVELSGGLNILLDGECRLVMAQENIEVQYLVEE